MRAIKRNSKHKWSRLALLLSMGFAGLARGETLLDVYRDALANDPDYAIALATVEMSEGDRQIARAGLLPTVSVSGMATKNRRSYMQQSLYASNFNNSNWQAGVSQPLFDLEAWHAFKEADATQRSAEWMLAGKRQDLIIRSVEAYLGVVLAENELRALQAEEVAVLQQLQEVEKRFDAGLIAIVDVLESQAAADATAIRRTQAQSSKEAAFRKLQALTSYSYQRIDGIGQDLPVSAALPRDRDAWIARALEASPAIRAASEELEAAQRAYRKSGAASLPRINAVVQQQSTQANDDPVLGTGFDETYVGLSFRWTPYEGGRASGMRARARAQIAQSEAMLRKQQLETDRDISILLRQIESDVEQVSAGARAIESASKALTAVTAGYDTGSREVLDVLQAQQRLNAVEYDYAKATHNYLLNLIRLKATAGDLGEDDIRQINDYCNGELPVWREGAGSESGARPKTRSSWQLNRLAE